MGTAGYLITNIFRVYLIYRFYNIFFTQYKINKKYVFFIYLIYYVINSVVYIQICIPVVTLAVNIVSLMAVTYIYQATFRKRMFYVMVQLGLSISACIGKCHAGAYQSEYGRLHDDSVFYCKYFLFSDCTRNRENKTDRSGRRNTGNVLGIAAVTACIFNLYCGGALYAAGKI